MPASLVLLSGGIESTTLLHQETRTGAAAGLFIDYGQRGAVRERQAATRQCAATGAPLTVLDMAAAGEAFRAGREQRLHVPIPHRNLVVLSLGLSFAAREGAERLCLAVNREDTTAYPSASGDFLRAFDTMAATLGPTRLATPLAALDKADVIRLGTTLGVAFADTYSCLLGYPEHCGGCPQCRHRRAAFTAAGVADPTRYRR